MAHTSFPKFDGTHLKEWLDFWDQFFCLNFTPPEHKIRIASAHLVGRALQWHQAYMRGRGGMYWYEYFLALASEFGMQTKSAPPTMSPTYSKAYPSYTLPDPAPPMPYPSYYRAPSYPTPPSYQATQHHLASSNATQHPYTALHTPIPSLSFIKQPPAPPKAPQLPVGQPIPLSKDDTMNETAKPKADALSGTPTRDRLAPVAAVDSLVTIMKEVRAPSESYIDASSEHTSDNPVVVEPDEQTQTSKDEDALAPPLTQLLGESSIPEVPFLPIKLHISSPSSSCKDRIASAVDFEKSVSHTFAHCSAILCPQGVCHNACEKLIQYSIPAKPPEDASEVEDEIKENGDVTLDQVTIVNVAVQPEDEEECEMLPVAEDFLAKNYRPTVICRAPNKALAGVSNKVAPPVLHPEFGDELEKNRVSSNPEVTALPPVPAFKPTHISVKDFEGVYGGTEFGKDKASLRNTFVSLDETFGDGSSPHQSDDTTDDSAALGIDPPAASIGQRYGVTFGIAEEPKGYPLLHVLNLRETGSLSRKYGLAGRADVEKSVAIPVTNSLDILCAHCCVCQNAHMSLLFYFPPAKPPYAYLNVANMLSCSRVMQYVIDSVTHFSVDRQLSVCRLFTIYRRMPCQVGGLKKIIDLLAPTISLKAAFLEFLSTIIGTNTDVIQHLLTHECGTAARSFVELINDTSLGTRVFARSFLPILRNEDPSPLNDTTPPIKPREKLKLSMVHVILQMETGIAVSSITRFGFPTATLTAGVEFPAILATSEQAHQLEKDKESSKVKAPFAAGDLLDKAEELADGFKMSIFSSTSDFMLALAGLDIPTYARFDNNEIFDIMNLLEDSPPHANGAVVLAITKKFMHLTLSLTEFHQQVYERIKAPLQTLVSSGGPEQPYAMSSHLHLLDTHVLFLLASDYLLFYFQYIEPFHVKILELQLLTAVATESNTYDIVPGLFENAANVEEPIARESLRAVGKMVLQQYDVNAILDRFLHFLEMGKDYVTSETLLLVQDLLRKYPQWSQDCIAVVGNISNQKVQEPKAKAALIWMVGESLEERSNAPYVLESLVDIWEEENSAEERLHLFKVPLQCFLKRPLETQKAPGRAAFHQDDNVRALLYYKFLHSDISIAGKVCENLKFFEIPTGWKFFGHLMDAWTCAVSGSESFMTGSAHTREKDGIRTVLALLSLLPHKTKVNLDGGKLVTVEDIVHQQHYYTHYDYENGEAGTSQNLMAYLVKIHSKLDNANTTVKGTSSDVANVAVPLRVLVSFGKSLWSFGIAVSYASFVWEPPTVMLHVMNAATKDLYIVWNVDVTERIRKFATHFKDKAEPLNALWIAWKWHKGAVRFILEDKDAAEGGSIVTGFHDHFI